MGIDHNTCTDDDIVAQIPIRIAYTVRSYLHVSCYIQLYFGLVIKQSALVIMSGHLLIM